MSLGCLEPQFFRVFIDGFLKALPNGFALSDGWQPTIRSQHDRDEWPRLREFIELGFKTNTRKYWTDIFHGRSSFALIVEKGLMRVLCKGTDACAVPVLSPEEATEHEVSKFLYPEPHPAIIGFSRGRVNAANKRSQTQLTVCPSLFVDICAVSNVLLIGTPSSTRTAYQRDS